MTALHRLELQDAPDPGPPPPGHVTLRIAASALGLTQLQLLAGQHTTDGLPRVLGHEMVGTVVDRAGDVIRPAIGDMVVVDALVGCGACRRCIEGDESICPDRRMIGYVDDGGYAELAAVPARQCFALPAGMEPRRAVMLASVVPSAVRAVRRAGVRPGDAVSVLGMGSLGTMIAQVARAHGATRIAGTDVDAERLALIAPLLDATVHVADPDPDAARRVIEAAGGAADVVFEAAGAEDAVRTSTAVVRPGGTVMVCGLVGPFAFPPSVRDAVLSELTVTTTYAFSRRDVPEGIALLDAGRLDLAPVTGGELALADLPGAAARMRERGTGGRRDVVLVTADCRHSAM